MPRFSKQKAQKAKEVASVKLKKKGKEKAPSQAKAKRRQRSPGASKKKLLASAIQVVKRMGI